MRDDHGRETLHEFLLDLAAQHGAAAVRLADRPQLVVVVHEEIEPLPADVHLQVAALLPVLLDREPPAAERVLVHLVLDLLRGVRDVDGGRGIGRGHLSALALQRGEESRLDERGLVSADARRRVAGHAKVRVLVDGARDQASKRLLVGAEEVREAVGERGRRLRGREADLADVGLAGEAEDAARLVERDALGDLQHVEVERGAHVVDVGEDERAPGVESARDDVLGVLPRQPPGVLELHGFPQELLVVGELDDEGHLESLLEPLGEVEGDEVAEVQGLRRRSAAGVEVKLLPVLVRGDDLVELAMGEEHAAAEEGMRAAARRLFDAGDERVVDGGASKLVDEFGVVDLAVGASRDVPRRDDLLAAGVRRFRWLIVAGAHGGDARGDLVDGGGHLALGASYSADEGPREPRRRLDSAAGPRRTRALRVSSIDPALLALSETEKP